MDSPNELRDMAGLKAQADNSLLRKIETAKSVYWAVSVLIGIIVAVAIWVTTIQNNQSNLRSDVKQNKDDIEVLKPKVNEMWWMKEAGITNADVKRTQQPRPSASP